MKNLTNSTPAQKAALFLSLHAEDMIDITGTCTFSDLRSEADRLIAKGHESQAVEAAIYNVAILKNISAQ
jgi:hypothetical protein